MNNPPTQSDGLSPEKLKLFEMLLKKKGKAVPQTQVIPKRAEATAYPLSFAQQGLWFLDQLQPGGTAYNVPMALRLCGMLDTAIL